MERTINERLAVVEVEIQQIEEDGKRREAVQEDMLAELREIRTAMSTVATDLARYRSFVGGCVFILMGLFAFIKLIVPWALTLLKVKTG